MAAKEKTPSGGEASRPPGTRVWGLPPGNGDGIGGSQPVTSTLHWGWSPFYAGTASGRLDGTYFRDADAIDYAMARRYSGGRFTTADPLGMKAANANNPMSWNRMMYVGGDPVNFSDANGMEQATDDNSTGTCGPDWMVNASESGPCCDPGDFLLAGANDPACYAGGGAPDPEAPTPPAAKPQLVPTAIKLIGDCYDRSAEAFGQAGGAIIDELTYQVLDQYGNPFLGQVSITEQNTVIKGNAINIDTSWNITNGIMQDQISSGAGQKVFQENESYYVSGSSTPLTIDWFFGSQYAVLGIYATPNKVIINNTVPFNRNGTPHYCDQPAGQQVK